MYYIDNYKQNAIEKVIPYLIEFPQIVSILEMSANRYQAIEDVMWKIADNFELENARGIFLNAIANNEVLDFEYTDRADDAFQFNDVLNVDKDFADKHGYGAGHYYNQVSYNSGIKKNMSEEKTIRAVKSKIIQNNTDCTVEDLREALKLLYNADRVRILESNPLNLTVMLIGGNLEISSSGNYENVKKMLPACVSFNNIFVDTSIFDLFIYDDKSSYGDSRYPIRLGEESALDKYDYISFSVNLSSEFKENIKTNHTKFDDNMFCCIYGKLSGTLYKGEIINDTDLTNDEFIKTNNTNEEYGNIYKVIKGDKSNYYLYSEEKKQWTEMPEDEFKDRLTNGTLFSTCDNIDKHLHVGYKEDAIKHCKRLTVFYNNQEYTIESNDESDDKQYQLSLKDTCTIIIQNVNNSLKLWLIKLPTLTGIYSQDRSYLFTRINSSDPDKIINDFTTIDAPIYLNCINYNHDNINYGDFTYCAVLFGDTENNDIKFTEYYVSCFGEKQILFNCLENKNHLHIDTEDTLLSNKMVKQDFFNYKETHSNGKYMYMDGFNGDGGYGLNYRLIPLKSEAIITGEVETFNNLPINNNLNDIYYVDDDDIYYVWLKENDEYKWFNIIDVDINVQRKLCDINNFEISFDMCMPIEIKHSTIIKNFVGTDNSSGRVFINENNGLTVMIPQSTTTIGLSTPDNIINVNEYINFKISYTNNVLSIYKNNILIQSKIVENIKNIPSLLKLGYNNYNIVDGVIDTSSFYKGILANLKYNMTYSINNDVYNINFELPLKNTLDGNIIKTYNNESLNTKIVRQNHSSRFITTPQLINDEAYLDIYGNSLINKRVPNNKNYK